MVHFVFWLYILSLLISCLSILSSLFFYKFYHEKWYFYFINFLISSLLFHFSNLFFYYIIKYVDIHHPLFIEKAQNILIILTLAYLYFSLAQCFGNLFKKRFFFYQKPVNIINACLVGSFSFFYLFITFKYSFLVFVIFYLVLIVISFIYFLFHIKEVSANPEKKVMYYIYLISVLLYPIDFVEHILRFTNQHSSQALPQGLVVYSIFCLAVHSINLSFNFKYFHSRHSNKDYPDVPDKFIITFQLTVREQEITEYLVKGYNNQDIGNYLYISKRTVDNHIYNIYRKCGISNRVELLNLLTEYR